MAHGSDELVSAACAGDQGAWRGLYVLHSARITALLRALPQADHASSAEDLVAEAWLTAATRMGDFTGSDDDFGGWLFTIARNHASNSHRTAVRRRTDPTDLPLDPARAGDDDPLARVEGHDTVRKLLAHLSPRQAEVVACIDVGGLDVKATARALGMSPTAVRVARHRALGRLRTLLDDA
ncbi:hypothetical protein NPS01_40810 [Nocardioides psychrotolerans]|uniref:RNA polymerase sigma-70 factor, ECF subfamily n=1 Tax=Nocardioides psychrotolerans TaxID=1005945 RepID=A0A1I3RDH2_9ACTN|nr:RNA polymerase sigma factor [Nocardioides psychrotolerans]GEP40418.1 hypothetical protein NPS01_40810 [Nocardioides psychrotolerans]SFJ43729.1 RNA polymerase sigma-70 factor, ECF subfamily [Nocardioides psychrotolerans]